MSGLNAGDLRHRVAIQSPTEARDTMGGVSLVWTDLATVWALVQEEAGEESYQDGVVRPFRTGTATLRNYPGLTTRHRLAYEGRVLNIESTVSDPDKVGMSCRWREEV